jgi:23S rRNA-/tRNA-specific pseudouridylate synthase
VHETEKIYIQINEEIANERADIALSKASEFSRSMIQKLIHAGNIKCDDSLVLKANAMTKVGQQYEITKLESNINHIIEEEGELNILFEDEFSR